MILAMSSTIEFGQLNVFICLGLLPKEGQHHEETVMSYHPNQPIPSFSANPGNTDSLLKNSYLVE